MKKDNKFVNNLLKQMTLEEKIGQLYQTFYYGGACTGPDFENYDTIKDIKSGRVGTILNISDVKVIDALQHAAVDNSRLHIPLMFMLDVIHGFQTSFPTPLAMSCSFNDEMIKRVARISGYEAAHSGINVTFSPMLDYVSDARWGRVNESNGEDVYLNTRLAKAYVKGYQTNNLKSKNAVGACCKHFVGYGAAVAGREYNRSEISTISLYQNYLPAFKEAIKNEVLGVMFAFNSVNNIPVLANSYITKDILRDELHFKGFTISDYGALQELINHRVAKDEYDAARLGIENGLDQEMVTTCYRNYLLKLCQDNPKYIKYVDDSCYNILNAKYKLGLFDDPYKNIFFDNEKYFKKDSFIQTSYEMALQSVVMLKNEILPLSKKKKVAILGPYGQSKELTGPWGGVSSDSDTISVYEAILADKDIEIVDDYHDSDVVIMCLGESTFMCGEGGARTHLDLPHEQEELLDEVYKANKEIIAVIFAGRPLVLTPYVDKCKAILYSFFLGMQGGKALKDIIFGDKCPSGKLTMSFPYTLGQVPLTYQDYPTGRPKHNTNENYQRFVTHYVDCENQPLYIFSDGLSFNKYSYSNFVIDKNVLTGKKDKITISFDITNNGDYDSDEIAFLFVESLHFSITRPYNELRNYCRLSIKAHETIKASFTVDYKSLDYYNAKLKKVAEEGIYKIKIGGNINSLNEFSIEYKEK